MKTIKIYQQKVECMPVTKTSRLRGPKSARPVRLTDSVCIGPDDTAESAEKVHLCAGGSTGWARRAGPGLKGMHACQGTGQTKRAGLKALQTTPLGET
eukprot:scaffold84934_cov56-Prasinocladus_malaysianus.AAC.4